MKNWTLYLCKCFALSLVFAPVLANTQVSLPTLNVFKTPTCGCCGKWVEHIQENGFATIVKNMQNLGGLKSEKGIRPNYQSCHTGVSQDGYVFEGHVPAKFIKQFLASPEKDAIGLSVPAMPVGSPGMEMGTKFHKYQVLVLFKDGTSKVFATVNSPKDQY